MKKDRVLLCAGVFGLLLLANSQRLFAQEGASSDAGSGAEWKQELASDKEEIKDQWQIINENAQDAKQEERDLQKQIHQAVQAGDFETAKNLRDQLHAMHQENIAQMHQDRQELQEVKQELRSDLKEARQEGALPPINPPGYNPPGVGPGNPPGYNPPGPGVKPLLPKVMDHREDIKDKREDIRDRKEDILDKKEDIWDKKHDGGRLDKLEDKADRLEDVRDRREDKWDRKEDVRDRGVHRAGGPAPKGGGKRK